MAEKDETKKTVMAVVIVILTIACLYMAYLIYAADTEDLKQIQEIKSLQQRIAAAPTGSISCPTTTTCPAPTIITAAGNSCPSATDDIDKAVKAAEAKASSILTAQIDETKKANAQLKMLKDFQIRVDNMGTFNAEKGEYENYDGNVPVDKLHDMIALGTDIGGNDTEPNKNNAGIDSSYCRNTPEKCYAYTFGNDWSAKWQNMKRKDETVMPAYKNADVNLYVRNARHVQLPSAKYNAGTELGTASYGLDVLKGNILTGAMPSNVDYVTIPDVKRVYPECLAAAGKDIDGAMIGMYNNKPWCHPFKSKNRTAASQNDPNARSYINRGATSMVYLKNPSTMDYSRW
jgi:hypothetical protein